MRSSKQHGSCSRGKILAMYLVCPYHLLHLSPIMLHHMQILLQHHVKHLIWPPLSRSSLQMHSSITSQGKSASLVLRLLMYRTKLLCSKTLSNSDPPGHVASTLIQSICSDAARHLMSIFDEGYAFEMLQIVSVCQMAHLYHLRSLLVKT